MTFIKYIAGCFLLLSVLTGCKKDTHDDTSFINSAISPDKLSALFDITQDNTGMVTITPNGEGASYYDINFGDGTAAMARVQPGKMIQHKYGEGNFDVKVIGYNIAGASAENTLPLTVSFREPENLEVTAGIDESNNFKVNVSAKADYETVFRAYFGEDPNEVPQAFQEGATVSHTYSAVGTYTIRVVALSGGAATTEYTQTITIVDPVLLPLNFESPTLNYNFINFDGGVVSVIDNPQSNGINTSSKVAKMVKYPGQPWGGSLIALSNPIDFSTNKVFRMKVWSPRVGAKVLFKVEQAGNGAVNFEKEVTTTVANAWEDLAFDYSAIDASRTYNNIVLIFELGTPGDGSDNFTFLFDDIRQTNTMPAEELGLPMNFESASLNYAFTNFDGGNASVVTNPDQSGINTSSKTGKMVKGAGQPWGGTFIPLANPINFSAGKTLKMKVWSPRVGAKVLLKVENLTDGNINFEKEVTTTVANAWEELSFDYNAINTANSYQKIVLIFDLGTTGDGSANFTFYFDDIRLN